MVCLFSEVNTMVCPLLSWLVAHLNIVFFPYSRICFNKCFSKSMFFIQFHCPFYSLSWKCHVLKCIWSIAALIFDLLWTYFTRLWLGNNTTTTLYGLLSEYTWELWDCHSGRLLPKTVQGFCGPYKAGERHYSLVKFWFLFLSFLQNLCLEKHSFMDLSFLLFAWSMSLLQLPKLWEFTAAQASRAFVVLALVHLGHISWISLPLTNLGCF